MRTVPRHQLDLAWAEDQAGWFREVISEDDIPRLTLEPLRTDSLLQHADLETKYRCAIDPTARQSATWESATLAAQAGAALYLTGLQSEGTVECVVHDSRVALPAVGPQWWMDISRWQTAVYYAMICRDRERTDLLCSVSQDLLRASTGGAVAPWAYPFFEAIKGWWRREEDCYSHLLEAAERANPDDPALASWGTDHIALNVFPQIRMFEALVSGQPAQFNDALADALEGHRTFWTRTSERARNPDGYVALALLAFTCLARESGFTIDVQSEYLPQHLVEGTWVGAFPT